MIREIDVKNFRCYDSLSLSGCSLVNVIVGDNGAGKTALLEAIFMALGGSAELGVRYRQQRGLENSFQGQATKIEQALWRDLFYRSDWTKSISVKLTATGEDNRSVTISRNVEAESLIPLSAEQDTAQGKLVFTWTDAFGNSHPVWPTMTPQGLKIKGGEQDVPDFFYFAANQTPTSVEVAGRLSEVSIAGQKKAFVDAFIAEYDWIKDLNVEVVAGSPAIYATMAGENAVSRPLANVSGGINKIVGVMLTIASKREGVVLVDEIENGLYYSHNAAVWSLLLGLARQYNTQLFITTHSKEWLEALVKASASNLSDISLWRVERNAELPPVVRQFSGEDLSAAVRYHDEVR